MRADGGRDRGPEDQQFLRPGMSLSLSRIPDGQSKGQSESPCPSVYAPTSALRSLSSVALSSAPATETLAQCSTVVAIHHNFLATPSSTFSFEATNLISSTFLREAIGALSDNGLSLGGDSLAFRLFKVWGGPGSEIPQVSDSCESTIDSRPVLA